VFTGVIESHKQTICKRFRITDNAMMETLKKPIGRPPKPADEKLEQRSIRLTRAQWQKIDVAGLDRLRELINRWRIHK